MENKKNKVGFVFFIIIVLILGIGGFFATRYFLNEGKGGSHSKKITSTIDNAMYKIDKNKGDVYYENEQQIMEELGVFKRDIYVNLTAAKSINESLNNESSKMSETIKYIKDVQIDEDQDYEDNEEGIYSLEYREYEDYLYEEYISLVVKDFTYNVIDASTPINLKAYVFNKKDNTMLSNEDILKKYDTTLDKIKDKIKTKLTVSQEKVDGEDLININKTLSDFKYALYINKIGKLEIVYIVSSTKQNYYDNMVIE